MSKLSINFRRMLVKWKDLMWLKTAIKANRATRRRCKLNNECHSEAKRRIQYREYRGELCIAIDNIPVTPVDGFDNDLLDSCRGIFQQYIFEQKGGEQ